MDMGGAARAFRIDGAAHFMVAQYIARTDDHRRLKTSRRTAPQPQIGISVMACNARVKIIPLFKNVLNY
jgi:hypothetical protein